MKHLQQLLQAARFAAEKHTGHFRKGSRREPYINHPIEVANFIATIGEVDDIDILRAALLHDTVEDCGVTAEEIAAEFGQAVADYVLEVTDDKSLPKHERKQKQVEHAPHLSRGAQTIKLADKISNIRDVVRDPGVDWDLTRRREYVRWGINVAAGLRGANTALEAEFDRAVAEAAVELDTEFN